MSEAAVAMGHVPSIVHGRRITGDVDLEIVEEVLGRQLNDQLVEDFGQNGLSAEGLRGSEEIVLVRKRPPIEIDNKLVDFGWVGDVLEIKVDKILALSNKQTIPVIATMGYDVTGQVYNVNGDTVAVEIAQALEATTLLFVTQVGQVLDQERRPLIEIDQERFEKGKNENWIEGGMRVKVKLGLDALESDRVGSACICSPDSIIDRNKSTELVV